MENINIQELAKTVGRTQKEVIDYCNKKGIAVENGNVSNEIAEKIKKGMSTEAPKKKKAVVFRPQNSSQPFPQKKKTVKKPAVSKEEDAKRTESTAVKVEKSQPVADNKQQETKMREEKQQEPVKKETGKREDNRNQKRDGGQKNNQNRDGQRNTQTRDGRGNSNRDGQRNTQNRDGRNNSNRDGQKNTQNRDGRNNSNRDGQRNAQNRDGRNNSNRDGQRTMPNSQRRENNQRRDTKFADLTPTLTKNETRGGKPLNKKERELREKSRQYEEKSGRKQENTKNISKFNPAMKKAAPPVKKEEEDTIKTITIPETMTIQELAEKMKQQPSALVKKLFLQGKMVTINSDIDFDTAEEIALEFNYICEKEVKVDVIEELLKEEEENEEDMVPRPPVVCVMGHVDHGKTSLLDAIRSTNVTEKEAGGITQHIGAYTVKCNGQDITFLDTPGHEAFTAMRMRGAKSTDIAILVVAADDGVMPQTVEAINHAKAAGVDIIVAINKIDKPSANVERVKQEMAEYNLIPEDWGGDTIFVPVSAHTREGLDTLLEMILLVSEVKELKANPNRKARGLVIEAQLDKGRGPVATVLVQKGTLHVGDAVAAGSCHGRVRAMIDDKGRRVKEAGPSTPVEILGLNDVPNAGEVLMAKENEKEARSFAETFIKEGRERMLEDTKSKLTLDGLFSQIQAGSIKELNLVVKADVQGSVEAVKQSLEKLSNEEVAVKVIHGGVGAINESDVTLAAASNAIVIGFNVRPDVMAKTIAEREKVDMRLYRVIYQAIEDVESAMKGMLDPIFEEKVIGHAVVRQTFKASGVGTIAGAYILDGVFQRNCSVRLFRDGEKIYEGNLASLKRFKDDVKEVKEGYECGLVLEKFNDIKEEDTVEAYTMVEVPR
ncbi:MAG TPA: translation initiation factor IF-2 [Candidatus Fimimorpha faecalis]|uniref:Translation initiation factor IF-2 n=1 Tax=Candidatus Fimimorpha faecalis TaxID=2840824 RepID=A0A9D1EGX0_9FIRM|nr:translation initiation factor IF-2 [Candidatus Fimimorpha faecalis]